MSLQNLSNLECISKLNLKEIRKCDICIEAKFAKKSFHSIDQNTEPLWVKFEPTRGGKNILLLLLMTVQDTVMCTFYTVRMR